MLEKEAMRDMDMFGVDLGAGFEVLEDCPEYKGVSGATREGKR